MKQLLVHPLLLVCSMCMFTMMGYSQSGWVRQTLPPPVQSRFLRGVSFTDANTGTVVGDSGTILHTTNGGTTWTNEVSGTASILRGVSVANVNSATVVGDSGTILHTTNGGATWTRQSSGTAHSLRAVSFTDANTGAAVGDSGFILHTTNGGTLWTLQSGGTTNGLNAISIIVANTGIVVGDSGTILRTTNGGSTWTNQSIGVDYQLYGVSFVVADTGTAVGYNYYAHDGVHVTPGDEEGGMIFHTTDGGTTWVSQTPDGIHNIWAGSPLWAVSFTDPNIGTVVGPYSEILRTTNGGGYLYPDYWRTGGGYWTFQPTGGIALYGVCFTNANAGTVVGSNGTILHTTTGGVTAVNNGPTQKPNQWALEQNYPNPFNPSTVISYTLPTSAHVAVKVYDVLGREIQTLINERQGAGNHSITFNAGNLAGGVYFYKFQSGSYSTVKKLVLLR